MGGREPLDATVASQAQRPPASLGAPGLSAGCPMSLRQVPLADGDPCWLSLAPFLTPSLVPGICDPHGLGGVFLQVVPGGLRVGWSLSPRGRPVPCS